MNPSNEIAVNLENNSFSVREVVMSSHNGTISGGLAREDILKFPFPYKLWIMVHVPSSKCLQWTDDGTAIRIDLARLQEYFHSPQSIFVIQTTAVFLKHLEDFRFERLEIAGAAATTVPLEVTYQHSNFQRCRLDLVAKVRRLTFYNLDNAQNDELKEPGNKANGICAARMRGDLCFMQHGFLTEIQKKRIQNETVMVFERESKMLEEKLKKSEVKFNANTSNKRGRSACLEREKVIVLPKEVYENPYDSLLAGKSGFQGRYGGYYGNCTIDQIDSFFGDYLPKYGEGGTLNVKNFREKPEEISQNTESLKNEIEEINSEPPPAEEVDVPKTTAQKTNKPATVTVPVPKIVTMPAPMKVTVPVPKIVTMPGSVPVPMVEVKRLFPTQSTTATAPLLDTSTINISASFDLSSGALEYNITKYSNESVIIPPPETINFVPVNQTRHTTSPVGFLNRTFERPLIEIQSIETLPNIEPLLIEPRRNENPSIVPAPQAGTTNEPPRPSEENNDFYDELRATFELLQNQPY